MKQCYIERKFAPASVALIATMNTIIADYQRQGFVLTVRQLYYQLVARDVVPNTIQSYHRVASVINDAKLAGLIDWAAIEDRTREFVSQTRWRNGAHILQAAISGYHKDMWATQEHRAFAIVEKEALVGVLEGVCREFDMPLLAARGYPSGSVLREFAVEQILPAMVRKGQDIVLFHLGDHDPSGIDMTRDLEERLTLFTGANVMVRRLALNMPQIEEQQPPENPAKQTDSRFEGYAALYGESSWELDALSPSYLADLIRNAVEPFIDREAWEQVSEEIEDTKTRIRSLSETFEE